MPKILIKRGTATQWTNSTTALLAGELGLDTTNNIIKVGDGSTLWNSLSGLTLTSAQVSELAQDALSTAFSNGTHSNITVTYNDNANSISLATGPDVVTTTSLNNTLTDPSSGYVSIGDVGVADGVASLGPDGKIPDSEIPSGIARDTEVSTAIANLVNSAPSTLDTLNELATALGNDANFSTTVTNSIAGKVSKSGGDIITAASASTNGLIIKGATSQTANLQQWQNSSGTVLSSFSSNGRLAINTTEDAGGRALYVVQPNGGYGSVFAGVGTIPNVTIYAASGGVGLLVQGAASQTANLQEWQDSSGTVLAGIGPNGRIYAQGKSGNTDDLLYLRRADNNISLYVNKDAELRGNFSIRLNQDPSIDTQAFIWSGTGSRSAFGVSGTSSTNPTFYVKGVTSQTSNLTEWQNSSGTVLAKVDASGIGTFAQGSFAGGAATIDGGGGASLGAIYTGALKGSPTAYNFFSNVTGSPYATVVVKQLSEQTTNLQEWQNSSGTVLSKVDASGNIFVGTNQVLTKEDEKNIYLTDSGTARTLGSGDAYKIIEFTSSNTIAVTIPNDASDTTFPIGSYVEVRQMGGGQITVSATSPATLVATDNQYKTRVQYSAIILEKRASNAWYLAGDTTA